MLILFRESVMYSVLIVEDEYASRIGVLAIVKSLPLQFKEILTASDGKEALEIVQHQQVDLVITDICMPKMDGLQLSAEIYHKWPNITVLIISGHDDFKYAQQAIKYNVKDFILKPIKTDDLTKSIIKAIENIETSKEYLNILKQVKEITDKLENSLWNGNFQDPQSSCKRLLGFLNYLPHAEKRTILKEILDELLSRSEQHFGVSFTPKQYGIPPKNTRLNDCFVNSLKNLNTEICKQRVILNYEFIRNAKTYIEDNLDGEIPLSDIGVKFNMNATYCSQLFKKRTGKTMVQYRTEIRMKKALELLQKSDHTVTEIALLIGYNDISYFTKTFKKFFGENPSNYRISGV